MRFNIKILIIILVIIVLFKLLTELSLKNDRNFILIGGHPSSGIGLMKSILENDSQIKCGTDESIITMRFVEAILNFLNKFQHRLVVTRQQLDEQVANYIINIMNNRHLNATKMCIQDANTIKYSNYLNYLFPNAKFIYMVGDFQFLIRK